MVHTLRTVEYDERGWDWRANDVSAPTWEQVDSSIRRLDKFRFPYVWLYLTPEPGNRDPDFVVMGGKRVYWMAGSIEGFFWRRYRNPHPNGNDEVRLWISDQGFSDDDQFCCHDIELVLRAVKYFYENDRFDPSLSWE